MGRDLHASSAPPRSALLLATVALLALVACDSGEGARCVLDSDCADFSQQCVEGICRGPEADAGRGDAGSSRRDSGPRVDAGGSLDAGDPDAGESDAGELTCTDPSGAWSLLSVGTECGTAMQGTTVTITASATEPCAFDVTPDSGDASTSLVGTVTIAPDGAVTATLDIGGLGSATCTGTQTPTQVDVTCGTCMVSLAPVST